MSTNSYLSKIWSFSRELFLWDSKNDQFCHFLLIYWPKNDFRTLKITFFSIVTATHICKEENDILTIYFEETSLAWLGQD